MFEFAEEHKEDVKSRSDIREKYREQIEERELFDNHTASWDEEEIGSSLYQRLEWDQEGTILYAFWYTLMDGKLVVTGDTSPRVYNFGVSDMNRLNGINFSYFAKKLEAAKYHQGKAWDREVAMYTILDHVGETKDPKENWRELKSEGIVSAVMSQHSWERWLDSHYRGSRSVFPVSKSIGLVRDFTTTLQYQGLQQALQDLDKSDG